jgi:hypothetical protein
MLKYKRNIRVLVISSVLDQSYGILVQGSLPEALQGEMVSLSRTERRRVGKGFEDGPFQLNIPPQRLKSSRFRNLAITNRNACLWHS